MSRKNSNVALPIALGSALSTCAGIPGDEIDVVFVSETEIDSIR